MTAHNPWRWAEGVPIIRGVTRSHVLWSASRRQTKGVALIMKSNFVRECTNFLTFTKHASIIKKLSRFAFRTVG